MSRKPRRTFALLIAAASLVAAACAGSGSSGADEVVDEGDWNATSASDDHDSTHLWIVNQAMRIAAKHADLDPVKRMLATMNNAECKAQWQQGLFDADYKSIYNQGRTDMTPGAGMLEKIIAGASWESHFYDPDTGLNYKGASSPKTAFTETLSHLQAFIQQNSSGKISACYELGLSLHYFTDMTQPMHTANFTAINRPILLHSNLEMYSMTLQSKFELADWSGVPKFTADQAGSMAFTQDTAKTSKALWIPGVEALVHAYGKHSEQNWFRTSMCFLPAKTNALTFLTKQARDNIKCWQGDPEVDAAVGRSLTLAQDRTAQLLFLIGEWLTRAPKEFRMPPFWIARQ